MYKKFQQFPDLLKPKEVAEILRVSVHHVYRLIRNKDIPSKKIYGTYRILNEDVLKYLKEGNFSKDIHPNKK